MERRLLTVILTVALTGCGGSDPGGASAPVHRPGERSEPAQANVDQRATPAQPEPAPQPAAAPPGAGLDAEFLFRQRIVDSVLETLETVAAAPQVVTRVIELNREFDRSRAEIMEIDAAWRATRGDQAALFEPYLRGACAEYLRAQVEAHDTIVELLVMDDTGCLVAAAEKTSDFWQGDEAKWQRSFLGSTGQLFVDEIDYDESSRAYVVQISLPVRNAEGVPIGALTASVLCEGR